MEEKKEDLTVKETPTIDTKVEKLKVKVSPKKYNKKKDKVTKIDLSSKKEEEEETKPEENAIQESSTESVDVRKLPSDGGEVGTGDTGGLPTGESTGGVIEDITNEEIVIGETKTVQPETPKVDLPENVEKLVDFMKETGGDINDYVRLNFDYDSIDEDVLLQEYYKTTKPHLDAEEVEFIIEDNFKYDEDYDEEKVVKKKKLAYKEEVAKAKSFLEETKNKYYDEIKLRPSLTNEQKKATEFFDRYNEDQEVSKKKHEEFKDITKNYFNQDFKGFEFNLGEKKFRYGINNPNELAETQSDIGNFVKRFLNEDGTINDHKGYHKAIYAAKNADTIAQHFYEQGKADAVKDVMAKSKNINDKPRQSADGNVYINGLKVKAVTGLDSTKLKVKKLNL